jgi:hypothetical protein
MTQLRSPQQTRTQQLSNCVFHAVRAEMLYAGPISCEILQSGGSVEEDSNASIAALRVVGGGEKGSQYLGL